MEAETSLERAAAKNCPRNQPSSRTLRGVMMDTHGQIPTSSGVREPSRPWNNLWGADGA